MIITTNHLLVGLSQFNIYNSDHNWLSFMNITSNNINDY
jgi:hypothetical protein